MESKSFLFDHNLRPEERLFRERKRPDRETRSGLLKYHCRLRD